MRLLRNLQIELPSLTQDYEAFKQRKEEAGSFDPDSDPIYSKHDFFDPEYDEGRYVLNELLLGAMALEGYAPKAKTNLSTHYLWDSAKKQFMRAYGQTGLPVRYWFEPRVPDRQPAKLCHYLQQKPNNPIQ